MKMSIEAMPTRPTKEDLVKTIVELRGLLRTVADKLRDKKPMGTMLGDIVYALRESEYDEVLTIEWKE
jgi:hypothetical protein